MQVEVTTRGGGAARRSRPARPSCCATTCHPRCSREVVAAVGDRAELEATGGLTLEVAPAYAATGVDYLSGGGPDALVTYLWTSHSIFARRT